jgi:hypothetical protein
MAIRKGTIGMVQRFRRLSLVRGRRIAPVLISLAVLFAGDAAALAEDEAAPPANASAPTPAAPAATPASTLAPAAVATQAPIPPPLQAATTAVANPAPTPPLAPTSPATAAAAKPVPTPAQPAPTPAPVKPASSAATVPATHGTPPFSTTGTWEIRRGDASVGGGCYAMTSYDPDIVLIVGFDLARAAVHLDIGSQRLQPIDPAQSYAMQIQFDKHKPWDSRAEVGLSDKVKFLIMRFQGGEFLTEFMNAGGLALREPGKDDDKDVLRLNLPRSGAAGKEIIRCQNGINPLGG